MQILVRGSGPPLVMLHGWAMHGGIFAPLAERLERHFQLHLVDLPGHGRSGDSAIPLQLDAVARFVAAQTPPALWLGWSLGGLIALHAAQQLPASVRGLVMLCASPRFVRVHDWPQGMADGVFRVFAEELGWDYAATIDRFLLLEAQGSDHAREEIRLLRDQVFACGQPSTLRLLEGLALLQDSDLRPGLSALSMPNLWIAGCQDRLVSVHALQLAAEQAQGRFLGIEHGSHAPFLSHSDEVANAIIGLSESLPA